MSPFQAIFEGGLLRPLYRFRDLLSAEFGEGEVVTLERHEERSKKSHDHFFVLVEQAFESLPEQYADRWATPDHMRKWALIKAGFRDESTFVCASKAEAPRLAAFLRQIDDYAVIVVSDAVVTRYTAKSQSLKAMGAKAFQDSKTKVLDILSGLLGTDITAGKERAAATAASAA